MTEKSIAKTLAVALSCVAPLTFVARVGAYDWREEMERLRRQIPEPTIVSLDDVKGELDRFATAARSFAQQSIERVRREFDKLNADSEARKAQNQAKRESRSQKFQNNLDGFMNSGFGSIPQTAEELGGLGINAQGSEGSAQSPSLSDLPPNSDSGVLEPGNEELAPSERKPGATLHKNQGATIGKRTASTLRASNRNAPPNGESEIVFDNNAVNDDRAKTPVSVMEDRSAPLPLADPTQKVVTATYNDGTKETMLESDYLRQYGYVIPIQEKGKKPVDVTINPPPRITAAPVAPSVTVKYDDGTADVMLQSEYERKYLTWGPAKTAYEATDFGECGTLAKTVGVDVLASAGAGAAVGVFKGGAAGAAVGGATSAGKSILKNTFNGKIPKMIEQCPASMEEFKKRYQEESSAYPVPRMGNSGAER